MDQRFERLRPHLAPTHRSEDERPPRAEAAVSVIFRAKPDLEVLLVRRAVNPRDPWSGHMAFPGGRRDTDDASILDTAIRETHEETGVVIAPEAALGRLPPVSPQSTRIPTIQVTPFVFGVAGDVEAEVASHEIDAVYWFGVRELRAPESRGSINVPLIGTLREFPAFTIGGQVIWGLTYRILSRFLDQTRELGWDGPG